jgi:hypothetical protein
MYIKKIETTNKPFIPYSIILNIDSPSDRKDLHNIVDYYCINHGSSNKDDVEVARRIRELLK